MRKGYRFDTGDKVRIDQKHTFASAGVCEHNGEIVTIKDRCSFTWAYHLEELSGVWMDGCFEKAE